MDLDRDNLGRVFAPLGKEDQEYQTEVLRKMKDFERQHGKPGQWFDKYKDDKAIYFHLTTIGEHSIGGYLYDSL